MNEINSLQLDGLLTRLREARGHVRYIDSTDPLNRLPFNTADLLNEAAAAIEALRPRAAQTGELVVALNDFRDAGGSAERVAAALTAPAQEPPTPADVAYAKHLQARGLLGPETARHLRAAQEPQPSEEWLREYERRKLAYEEAVLEANAREGDGSSEEAERSLDAHVTAQPQPVAPTPYAWAVEAMEGDDLGVDLFGREEAALDAARAWEDVGVPARILALYAAPEPAPQPQEER